MQQYGIQQAGLNAQSSALGGLFGTALGGWGYGGFKNPFR
jgi:hypothetical protein